MGQIGVNHLQVARWEKLKHKNLNFIAFKVQNEHLVFHKCVFIVCWRGTVHLKQNETVDRVPVGAKTKWIKHILEDYVYKKLI